jgi:hypothetical protein
MSIQNETIVDRVVQRLKSQPLGDLITEEDLHDIVKQAIPKTFFEKRFKITNPGSFHERREEVEPAIFEIMRDLLQDSAKKAVAAWMIEHAEEVAKILDEGLRRQAAHLRAAAPGRAGDRLGTGNAQQARAGPQQRAAEDGVAASRNVKRVRP